MQSTRNCGSCDPGDEQPPPRGDCFCLTLLLVGVTWPRALPPAPVVFYTTFSPLPTYLHPPLNSRIWGRWEGVVGGLFLWPNPSGCPVPGVTRRHAPWSADFPRQRDAAAVIRPAWGNTSYHDFNLDYGGNTSRAVKSTQYKPAVLGTSARMASPIILAGSVNLSHHCLSAG